MARLADELRAIPAQIEEHAYSYSSFGSWTTVVRSKGTRFRIVFDGKEGDYSIQQSTARKPPDTWGRSVWGKAENEEKDLPLNELVAAIAKCAAAG